MTDTTAYINLLPQGEYLVEIQKKEKNKTEAFFVSFTNEKELNQFKEENQDMEFITN